MGMGVQMEVANGKIKWVGKRREVTDRWVTNDSIKMKWKEERKEKRRKKHAK